MTWKKRYERISPLLVSSYDFLEQRRQVFLSTWRPELADLIVEVQKDYLRELYEFGAPACGGCASWYYTGFADVHDEECLYES